MQRPAAVLLALAMLTFGLPAAIAAATPTPSPTRTADRLVDERADGQQLASASQQQSLELHLLGDDETFPDRRLAPEAPDTLPPHTDTVKLAEDGSVAWTSERFEQPFTVDAGSVDLWMSFTSTTPNLAINFFDAKLVLLLPDGNETTIAQRAAVADPDTNENEFTTPLVPQRVHWELTFSQRDIPAGAQLQLELISQGVLGFGAQGPATVYYDSTEYDSRLTLQGDTGEPPTIPVTDPPLGTESYRLSGASGEMRQDAEPGSLEPVPAVGDADTTPAVWTSPPLPSNTTLERAVADLWVSSTVASPFIALNFLDAKLFAVADGDARLIGQREEVADPEANPNVFTVPGEPERLRWDLQLSETELSAGTRLRLAITAESLPGFSPTEATVYTQGAAHASLVLATEGVSLSAQPDTASVDEPVNLSGSIHAGQAPWTYTWVFDDGNSSGPHTTSQPEVSTEHAYTSAGSYEPTLVVHDAEGLAGGDTASVTVEGGDGSNTTISDVAADPSLPELGTLAITWTTDEPGDSTVRYAPAGEPLDQEVTIDDSTTDHRVRLDGLEPAQTYDYEVETNNVTSAVHQATTAGDFTGDSHTVVAYVDSGINPYHETFQRPDRIAHPATYLDGFPADAEALNLDLDAPSYDDALANDSATYQAIAEGELHWIPGTNVVGAIDQGDASAANSEPDETPLLDDDGHGTAVAGTITDANPEVLLTTIEGLTTDGIGWAARQPWIDVISVSSASTFPSAGQHVPDSFDQALANGKLLVYAAGNTPNPDVVFPPSSYPQTISVGGAYPDVNGTEPLASKTPDVVSNFTVEAPTSTSREDTQSISGTSFAAPNTAGSLSAAILELRRGQNDTTEDTTDGVTTVPAASPYADDGKLTNHELWDAMNRSAEHWRTEDWRPSFTVPPATATPWLTMGWGFVGPSVSGDIASTVTGEQVDEKPPEAHTWMALDETVHQTYNGPARDAIAGELRGTSVPAPVYQPQPLSDPIATEHPYRNDANRTWTVQLAGADAVAIHFENFTIETGFDRVDLETPDGELVASYSESSGASFWSAPVPGDQAVIRLVTDGGLARYGFDVHEIGSPAS